MRRVGVLWNPAGGVWEFRETELAARTLALQVQAVPVGSFDKLDAAFKAAVNGGFEGLTVLTTPHARHRRPGRR